RLRLVPVSRRRDRAHRPRDGQPVPEPRTAPSAAVLAVKFAIGAGLLLIALRQRRRIGAEETQEASEMAGAHRQDAAVACRRHRRARPAMAPCRCYRRHRRGGEALLRGDLHLALPVLSHRNFVRPRYGDPCGLPARAIPRSPRPRKGLDRHLHGSGHHHRVCLAWVLAYREGQLPTRDPSAQITGQTRISTLGSNSCCAPDASAADDAAVGPDPSTLPAAGAPQEDPRAGLCFPSLFTICPVLRTAGWPVSVTALYGLRHPRDLGLRVLPGRRVPSSSRSSSTGGRPARSIFLRTWPSSLAMKTPPTPVKPVWS